MKSRNFVNFSQKPDKSIVVYGLVNSLPALFSSILLAFTGFPKPTKRFQRETFNNLEKTKHLSHLELMITLALSKQYKRIKSQIVWRTLGWPE